MTPKTMQQLYRLNVGGSFPIFIDVVHEDISGGIIRLVNAKEDMVYDGYTYRAASFRLTPPKYADGKFGNGTITISCIDQEVVVFIRTMRALKGRPKATVVAAFYFEAGDLTIDPIEEWEFEMTIVNWTEVSATWQMVFDDRMSLVCPVDIMTAVKCPGAT